MKDLTKLPFQSRQQLYKLACKNYLVAESKKSKSLLKPFECENCGTLMLRRTDLHGGFQCVDTECLFVYCTECHERITNEETFRYHKNKKCQPLFSE